MTVCLAAICRDGDRRLAVAAADRMVTLAGFIEWEHAEPKMTAAASEAVVMVAGDTLLGTRLAREVGDAVAGGSALADVAARLATQYEATRKEIIEEQVLAARGLTFQTFYQHHSDLNPQVTFGIDQQMTQFNLGIELLLTGVDGSGAHIFTVHNPGRPERLHDVIGYAAIGSGAIHSLQSLIGFGHSAAAEYHETVFRVYASKRRAEVAPGVGRDTDMAVISNEGIHRLTEQELGQLKEIYEGFEAATGSELTSRLENFKLGDVETDEQTDVGSD